MKFPDMAPARPDGVRQAALLVHAMDDADREWMWAKLPTAHGQELKRLIDELDELGVAKDQQALMQTLVGDDGRLDPSGGANDLFQCDESASVPLVLSDIEFLCALTFDELDELARNWSAEPPQLVALALDAHDWPWRTNLLERMPILHKRRIEGILSTPGRSAPGLLVQAVLQVTRARLNLTKEFRALNAAIQAGPVRYDPDARDSLRHRDGVHSSRVSESGAAKSYWISMIVECVRVLRGCVVSSRAKDGR